MYATNPEGEMSGIQQGFRYIKVESIDPHSPPIIQNRDIYRLVGIVGSREGLYLPDHYRYTGELLSGVRPYLEVGILERIRAVSDITETRTQDSGIGGLTTVTEAIYQGDRYILGYETVNQSDYDRTELVLSRKNKVGLKISLSEFRYLGQNYWSGLFEFYNYPLLVTDKIVPYLNDQRAKHSYPLWRLGAIWVRSQNQSIVLDSQRGFID